MKIIVKSKCCFNSNRLTETENEYVIDFENNKFEGYKPGDLICFVWPFFSVPLMLEFAIRNDGTLVHRKWKWQMGENGYLHTYEKKENFTPTQEQIDAVNGLFSGRILYRGLKIAVGGTVQDICPINLKKEEELIGRRIFVC